MPVRAEIYFSFKSSDMVDMLDALQSQLFNFWASQKICYIDINFMIMLIINSLIFL